MQEPVYEQLTLFQADSPASRSVWLESRKEGKMTVICGQRCEGLSPSLSHVGWWVRTYLESCELPLRTLSRTWKAWAITSSCWILKLRLSEHSTGASESPLWPTVTTMDNLPPKSAEALQREAQGARMGRKRPANLRDCVQPESMRLWPTVTVCGNNQHPGAGQKAGTGLATAVRMWPTPVAGNCGMTATTGGRSIEKSTKLQTQVMLEERKQLFPTIKASDFKGSGPAGSKSAEHDLKRGNLKGYIMYATPQARDYRHGQKERWENPNRSRNLNDQYGGQLNPTWVEWLMGFPTGWTE